VNLTEIGQSVTAEVIEELDDTIYLIRPLKKYGDWEATINGY